MAPLFVISVATQEDLTHWAEMRNQLWPDNLAEHQTELSAYFSNTQHDIHIAWIAKQNSTAVGFLELNIRNFAEGSTQSPVPYIEGWFVRENWRNKGIGSALMKTAEQWSLQNGFNELASDTTPDNLYSQQLHQKLGFKEVERVICYLKPLA